MSLFIVGLPGDEFTMKEMKEQVDELKKENANLRNHVISSKIEDDKLFLILEEQIKALKIENYKLGNSLQLLITQMEEQTAVFKKENEMRKIDPYKSEIDKLKEQVNLLEIDNEELQKQLVRMRYGAYTHNSENNKKNEHGIGTQEHDPESQYVEAEKEEESDKNEDTNENVHNFLAEEIEKLKTKLYSEVDELKDWKEAITNLIKRLNEKEKKNPKGQDSLENKNTAEEKFRKHSKEDKNERPNKEQKWSDWSWKDLKRNFKDTFDNINVSDMFSKYTSVDEKKVKGYFDSVNHYFKKAQEKTKKILNFNENRKDEVWNFLGDLRKKWADMRNEFFKNHHKNGPMPVPPNSNKNEQKREQASSFSDKPDQFENGKRKNSNHLKTKDQQLDQEQTSQNYPKKDQMPTLESMMNDPKLKHIMETRYGPGWEAEMKKYIEEQNLNDISNENEWVTDDIKEQAKKPEGSWMFNRAAIRSILRERDEQDDSMNWYLRRKKTAKGDFETGSYDGFEEKE